MNLAIAALSNLQHLGRDRQHLQPPNCSAEMSVDAVWLCCVGRPLGRLFAVNATPSTTMNPLRSRVHRLIDRLSDDELESLWPILEALYYDYYMLRAIHDSKQTLQPGDTLTREEALRSLPLL